MSQVIAMRISNWRISHSLKQSASKWTHFLIHYIHPFYTNKLCVKTWYFVQYFVFYHFHYNHTNGILCLNSCFTSFHSLTKTPLYQRAIITCNFNSLLLGYYFNMCCFSCVSFVSIIEFVHTLR